MMSMMNNIVLMLKAASIPPKVFKMALTNCLHGCFRRRIAGWQEGNFGQVEKGRGMTQEVLPC